MFESGNQIQYGYFSNYQSILYAWDIGVLLHM